MLQHYRTRSFSFSLENGGGKGRYSVNFQRHSLDLRQNKAIRHVNDDGGGDGQ